MIHEHNARRLSWHSNSCLTVPCLSVNIEHVERGFREEEEAHILLHLFCAPHHYSEAV
jgi:hypothetical protein